MYVMRKTKNEKRLIEANALVKCIELLAKHEDSFRQSVILGVVHTVKAQPTVDAVEVVRCRDCIHYFSGACLKIYSDGNVSQDAWQERNEDDFCSYGERKEGDGNG